MNSKTIKGKNMMYTKPMQQIKEQIANAESNRKHRESINVKENNNYIQSNMLQATHDIIEQQKQANILQQETNKTLEEQCNALIEQNRILAAQNVKQDKVNWIMFACTIFIAIIAVIAPIVVAFV